MSEKKDLILADQPATMYSWYIGASYLGSKNQHKLTFEVDEDTWLQFKASVPAGAVVIQQFVWNYGDPTGKEKPGDESPLDKKRGEPEKKVKPSKTPSLYGWFYEPLYKYAHFQNSMSLLEVLKIDEPKEVRGALHQEFFTESLAATVPPFQFIAWLKSKQLLDLVIVAQGIVRDHQEKP